MSTKLKHVHCSVRHFSREFRKLQTWTQTFRRKHILIIRFFYIDNDWFKGLTFSKDFTSLNSVATFLDADTHRLLYAYPSICFRRTRIYSYALFSIFRICQKSLLWDDYNRTVAKHLYSYTVLLLIKIDLMRMWFCSFSQKPKKALL